MTSSRGRVIDPRVDGRAALRMIRETIETLGPPGALPSEEAVLAACGPELVHEAEAICEALVSLLSRRQSGQTGS